MRAGVVTLILFVIMVLVGGLAWRCLWYGCPRRLPRLRRRWRPRTPDDCAHCRLATTGAPAPIAAVRPWREGRNRRGAPRRIPTQGHACRRPGCLYEGITDAGIHALVADGHHGQSDRIQDFRCEACGSKVSARWGTALASPGQVVRLDLILSTGGTQSVGRKRGRPLWPTAQGYALVTGRRTESRSQESPTIGERP